MRQCGPQLAGISIAPYVAMPPQSYGMPSTPSFGMAQLQELDNWALQQKNIFAAAFPGSTAIVPGIGLPSQNMQGWALITHQLDLAGAPPMMPPTCNGFPLRGPLDNNAFLSFELSTNEQTGEQKFVNRYEVMLPDIPNVNGGLSSTQYYVKNLQTGGVIVDGDHFHWAGTPMSLNGKDYTMYAIHNTNIGMTPAEFAHHQVDVLVSTLNYILSLPG
jgi:hypothetical protein